MTFTAPIRRKDTAKTHYYIDAAGRRVPGVTTILGEGVPKPALINWSAKATAEATVDNWANLDAMSASKRLDWMLKARYLERDAAANRGTEVHKYGEALVKGEEVQVPEEIAGYVESYARFLDAFKVTPVHVEFSVANFTVGYAGTGDLIADLAIRDMGVQRLLIDLKTNKSGIFGETALQLAAYRYAEVLIEDNERDLPMPEVDGCAAVHVTPNGAHLIPVTADEQVFLMFRYAAKVASFTRDGKDLVGSAIDPAIPSTFRLVREESA